MSVNVCRPFRRAERFFNGAVNEQHRLSAAYPQGRFSACVSVRMGLLRNRSHARQNPPG